MMSLLDTLSLLDSKAQPMEKSRRGIQSIEIGSALLLQMARHVRPIALKDLSKDVGMTAGKAHPYMVSFLKVGFVTQNDAGHYELGPLALQDRKSTRLNSSHIQKSRMPSSA